MSVEHILHGCLMCTSEMPFVAFHENLYGVSLVGFAVLRNQDFTVGEKTEY